MFPCFSLKFLKNSELFFTEHLWTAVSVNFPIFWERSEEWSESAILLERSTNTTTLVSSYYILLPSAASTMLIKSIASRDIMMPYDTQDTSNVKSATVMEFVDQQMRKVGFILLIMFPEKKKLTL